MAVADLLLGLKNLFTVGTYALPRHFRGLQVKIEIVANPFEDASSGTCMFFLQCTYFSGTSICLDLSSSSSSNKYQNEHLKCCCCVVSWNNCGCIEFVSFLRHLPFAILRGSLLSACRIWQAEQDLIKKVLVSTWCITDKVLNKPSNSPGLCLSRLVHASFGCYFPSLAFRFAYYYLLPGHFPMYFYYSFTTLYLTNSLVNPITYSLRMPFFRHTLKRLKNDLSICEKSERYSVNAGSYIFLLLTLKTKREKECRKYVS